MQENHHYDIIIIGSGPAGQKAAIQASKLKKKVALIEKLPRLGGASLHTGTIPSKSLRETVMHLALLRQQTHGIEFNFKENITTQELMYRKDIVIQDQENSLRRNFEKNGINVIEGTPRFQSTSTLEITPTDRSEIFEINGAAVEFLEIFSYVAIGFIWLTILEKSYNKNLINSIIKFEFIESSKSKNIDQNNSNILMELIAIDIFKKDNNFEITLLFSKNRFITLLTEVIEVTLEDQELEDVKNN